MISTLSLFTSRVGCTRPGAVDITTKLNPNHVLAPGWELVGGIKHWGAVYDGTKIPDWARKYPRLSPEQYTERYIALMRERWATREPEFKAMIEQAELGLCCLCSPGDFCHRCVAAEKIVKPMAAVYDVDVLWLGELSKTMPVMSKGKFGEGFPTCPWCLDDIGTADAPCAHCLSLGAVPGEPPGF